MGKTYETKRKSLGMCPSAADRMLLRKLLFKFIPDRACHRCGEQMAEDNFSVEHAKFWRHEPNAIKLFFDLDNIVFSHHKCNSAFTRRRHATDKDRLAARRANNIKSKRKLYTTEKRRAQWLRTGN